MDTCICAIIYIWLCKPTNTDQHFSLSLHLAQAQTPDKQKKGGYRHSSTNKTVGIGGRQKGGRETSSKQESKKVGNAPGPATSIAQHSRNNLVRWSWYMPNGSTWKCMAGLTRGLLRGRWCKVQQITRAHQPTAAVRLLKQLLRRTCAA
mmetsp:Transcript_29167/g.82251  ORF Transcript_29167/g.82251 Transcript_29167/m.82251 type:complete len:149 (+) Transcript_29167:79-525(+)